MKRSLVLLLALSSTCYSQLRYAEDPSEGGKFTKGVRMSQYTGQHSYDVLNYNLFMDWTSALDSLSTSFRGIMKITFRPDLSSQLDSIGVDTDPQYLQVDSAVYEGALAGTDTSEGKVFIHLRAPVLSGDTGVVTLYYRVNNPGISANVSQKGFYFYYKGEQVSGQIVPHTLAYTMSEPSDARAWMPCYDDPSDKALCEISIRVPDGFVAASNGTLRSKVENGDGTATFNWSEDYPIATYLMCATAARFSVIQTEYTKSDSSKIPVQYYVYPEDSSSALANTECNIDTVVSMIKFYVLLYGEYPFDKYGMTGIQPFYYGGMEHQTITTMNRKYEFNRRDVAHELAHQWWGDMVTLGTWKDIWLNEGFATYSEAMQLQHTSPQAFREEMDSYASQYFAEDSVINYPVYAPPSGYIFGLAEYYKGAWVLHMLRDMVGDSMFFAILRTYRTDFEYGNAVTSDFMNVTNEVTHSNYGWFFNEWIYGTGYPIYSFVFTQAGSTVSVVVSQVQKNGPAFRMPLDIGIYSGGSLSVTTVMDSLPTQSFELYSAAKVDSVSLDPNDHILKAISKGAGTKIEVRNPATDVLLQNYPNPFNGTTVIDYYLPTQGKVNVDVFDVLGRKVETLVDNIQAPGLHSVTFDGSDLASGIYLCRLVTPTDRVIEKLVLEK